MTLNLRIPPRKRLSRRAVNKAHKANKAATHADLRRIKYPALWAGHVEAYQRAFGAKP